MSAAVYLPSESITGMLIRGRLGRGAEVEYDEQRRQFRPSWVYFIAAGQSAIKIGRGTDVAQRLSMLQIGNHEELTLLAKIYGAEQMERACHRYCATSHIRGEWFAQNPKVLRLVKWALELPRPGE